MDFSLSPRALEMSEVVRGFMDDHVYPAEPIYEAEMLQSGDPHFHPPILESLKTQARQLGLWNLFLGDEEWGSGLSNVDYAPLAEITGWSPQLAPEALNCSAPDTGNMELLAAFGTTEQKQEWLVPMLDGQIRSCFSMTEPDVASSDATNIRCRIARHGESYVVTGRKWWSTGALSPRCKLAIVMGVTNPDANTYQRQSMILVPLDTPGVAVTRGTTVYGYEDRGGHGDIEFRDARVPAANLLGEEGSGFAIAQSRLGPGRIHHCMRLIGMAERALALARTRAQSREAFGKLISEQGVVQDWIAEARILIEQARLLVLKTAWLMDTVGNREARTEIAAIKVAVPRAVGWIIDRSIQIHGGAGLSQDLPLARLYSEARILQIADGPDEVHKRSIARRELRR